MLFRIAVLLNQSAKLAAKGRLGRCAVCASVVSKCVIAAVLRPCLVPFRLAPSLRPAPATTSTPTAALWLVQSARLRTGMLSSRYAHFIGHSMTCWPALPHTVGVAHMPALAACWYCWQQQLQQGCQRRTTTRANTCASNSACSQCCA